MINHRRIASHASRVMAHMLLVGCASAGGMKNAPLEAGVAREFPGSYEAIVRAARDATVQAGLAIDSFTDVDSSTAMIVAKKGSSLFSYGELVRVVVQRTGQNRTAVRVYTKRKLATNVTAKGDYSETIFENIALSLR
jgi:hypothetical protein